MESSEEYLSQHFLPRPSQTGAKENSDAYNTRMYWFKNNFPTYNEVARAFNFKPNRIRNYANKYNWKLIRQKYEELLEKEYLRQVKKEQKRLIKDINTSNEITFKTNNKRREHLLFILNELPNNPAPRKLDREEEKEVREELAKIEERLMKLQPLMRTNHRLTNNYTDKQVTENYHRAEVKVEEVKTLKQREKENEDYFRKLEQDMARTESTLQNYDN